ncbi:MAG: hypothetical protein R3F38_17225 [Gammaproteobacteria bacterium]
MRDDLPLLPTPKNIIFDWHGTLVDTQDAMLAAMEEMLPQLEELGLIERLQPESECKSADDVKLVRYIRIFAPCTRRFWRSAGSAAPKSSMRFSARIPTPRTWRTAPTTSAIAIITAK